MSRQIPVERFGLIYAGAQKNIGPAGCALVIIRKNLLERGSEVTKRGMSIRAFEKNGIFDKQNNYAFGEGGAGTFSDGKLTSRSKHISAERRFIMSEYVKAGAPKEILIDASVRSNSIDQRVPKQPE